MHVEVVAPNQGFDDNQESSAEVAEEVVHDNQIPRRDFELNRRVLSAGLEHLDQVEFHNVFRTRALVMKNAFMMKGVFRVALTIAMGEFLRGHDDGDEFACGRGWKMLMCFQRVFLATAPHQHTADKVRM